MTFKVAVYSVVAFCLGTVGADAGNYPPDLFSVAQLHFDSVRQPRGFDWYLQTREANVILSSIAAYMGINPTYVSLAMSARPKVSLNGEETNYTLPVPSGYQYCSSRVGVRSIISGGGRAPVLGVSVTSGAMAIYTWTPNPGLGQGQSSVEGDAQVIGIMPSYFGEFKAKGVCKDTSAQPIVLLSCEGNPCPGYEHGRVEDVGPTTPDLTKGF